MRNLPNIERSVFRPSTYIGWDREGLRYRINRNGPRGGRGSWWVYPDGNDTDRAIHLPVFYAPTLAIVSERLEDRNAICTSKRR